MAGGLVAILVAWDFVADYAKKAAIVHTISLECSALESDWRELWHEVNDWEADDAQVRDKMRALNRKVLEVTGRAGTADIREDERLNEKCAESAYKVVGSAMSSRKRAGDSGKPARPTPPPPPPRPAPPPAPPPKAPSRSR